MRRFGTERRVEGEQDERGPDQESGVTVMSSVAEWLSLAAAPVFTIMALLTAQHGSPADILCSAAHGSSPLSSMTLMYALMSVFHATPWVRMISR